MSRQRHENKRSDGRQAPAAQRRRRQTPKNAQTSPTASAGARAKRSDSQSPRPITTAEKPPAKAAPKATAKSPTKATPKATAKSPAKAALRQRKSAVASAPVDQFEPFALAIAAVRTDVADSSAAPAAPAIAQSPELPEIPEVPETPEMPEVPETPEIPEMPEIPEIPEIPEVPETPETPESPEPPIIPETPEIPEIPEQPEEPIEPTRTTEPNEPSEPDNPAVRAPEAPDAGLPNALIAEPDEAEAAPGASGRRLPTLAVMAHRRREPGGAAKQPSEASQASDATSPPPETPDAVETATQRADAPTQKAPRRPRFGGGKLASGPVPAQPERLKPSDGEQRASAVTRPVAARFSNRQRKAPRLPGLIWESYLQPRDFTGAARRSDASRHYPLPAAGVVMPVVVLHIFVMALMGVIGALIALEGNGDMAAWTLGGAVIVGTGGACAYAFNEKASWSRFAPRALVVSQLALLAWAMLALGPRASLLALIPALTEIALLMSGTLLAGGLLLGSLLIYAFFAGLSISIGLTSASVLTSREAVALDVAFVVVGLLAALWLLMIIQSGRERAQAIARARRHEADVLRNLMTQLHQEAQDETGKLEAALIQALKGHGIRPVPAEGMYRLLAETIMDTAARLEVLQRDREERLRLEGALQVLIRAVERQWLGVEPDWPGHTGTAVDELVALLRTPRLEETYQRETESPSITPRIIPIPTVAIERDTPPPSPISRPLSGASWLSSQRRGRRSGLFPLPSADEDIPTPD